jgi:S-adenosylmethionine/arginine decarboxylase-like enzyme
VLDLASLAEPREIRTVDLEPFLFGGMILREKHFRDAVNEHDWDQYAGTDVAVTCSVDTIVPTWAYMLITARLESMAHSVTVGTPEDVLRERFIRALDIHDWTQHQDRIVVVKGCGTAQVPTSAFAHAMTRLQTVAAKVMFGEPCSSVPLWRRSKTGAAAG